MNPFKLNLDFDTPKNLSQSEVLINSNSDSVNAFRRPIYDANGKIRYQQPDNLATSVGSGSVAQSVGTISIGANALARDQNTLALGYHAQALIQGSMALGNSSQAGAFQSLSIGNNSQSMFAQSIALGFGSKTTKINQFVVGSPSSPIFETCRVVGENGQAILEVVLTELLIIAAAATTDTIIAIPANVIVKSVSVRTTTVIPTAATYTVIGTGTGTVFNTANVGVAAGSTNKGNKAGYFFNATSQTIRITPNLSPATNSGRVRVTIIYEDITPPTS